MSQFARRVYYLSAFLLFAVLAPLLLAWTGGYRWENIRSGFVRTGAIVVYSDPKATLYLNNEAQGTTPLRLTHVAPGAYTLELRKEGFGTWTHALRVSPSIAQVIGPVFLYPVNFTSTALIAPPSSAAIVAVDQQNIFSINTVDASTTIQTLWPVTALSASTLPFVPLTTAVSSDRQSTAWQDTERTMVITTKSPTAGWDIGRVDSLAWDSSSATILYGIQLGQAKRFDYVTRQITDLTPATSVVVVNDKLWFTNTIGTTTNILRMNSFGQQEPEIITSMNGTWSFVNGLPNIAVVKNSVTGEMVELNIDPITNQPQTFSFGSVDKLWWPVRSQSPLWLNNSDLLTLDDQHQPIIIDRLSTAPSIVRWIDDGHILAIGDDQSFSIRSVSSRQGRGILLEKQFAAPSTVLTIDTDKKTAVVQTSNQPLALEELHW
jgi:hypothetical protein